MKILREARKDLEWKIPKITKSWGSEFLIGINLLFPGWDSFVVWNMPTKIQLLFSIRIFFFRGWPRTLAIEMRRLKNFHDSRIKTFPWFLETRRTFSLAIDEVSFTTVHALFAFRLSSMRRAFFCSTFFSTLKYEINSKLTKNLN